MVSEEGRVIIHRPTSKYATLTPLMKQVLLVNVIAAVVTFMLFIILFTRACFTRAPGELLEAENTDESNAQDVVPNDIEALEDL